jgi:chemotaxis protein MotB
VAREKKKKRPEPSGPPGAPEWVVTFTDMISLLVTFFVLLMTFSSIEDYEKLRVDGFLTKTRGNIKQIGGQKAYETVDEDIVAGTDIRRGADRPHSRPAKSLAENLEKMGQKKSDEEIETDFTDVGDGLQIVFGPECSFEPGSTKINAALRRRLDELGRVLEHYPHLVVVQGYTDSEFVPDDDFPDAETLSLERALAAAEILLAGSNMTPKLLEVAGLGGLDPRGDNKLLEGRLANRRVEIRVIALSKTRADHLTAVRREEARR